MRGTRGGDHVRFERARHRVGPYGQPVGLREHVATVLPRLTPREPLFELALAVRAQGRDRRGRDRDDASAVGLGRAFRDLARDRHPRASHGDVACLEIHVLPHEAAELTAPHASPDTGVRAALSMGWRDRQSRSSLGECESARN